MKRRCFVCGESFRGRSDKKFCSAYCRSAYHNRIYADEDRCLRRINNILRRNRRLLMAYASVDSGWISKQRLLDQGFLPAYCTGYVQHSDGTVRYLCYELIYQFEDNGRLVHIERMKGSVERSEG